MTTGTEAIPLASAQPIWLSLSEKLAPYAATVVFAAPLPTIQKITAEKTTGNLLLLPYSSMIVNCFVWIVYGLLIGESKIWMSNSVGLILGIYYVKQFVAICPPNAMNLPGTISQHIRIGATIIGSLIPIAFLLPKDSASATVGTLGVAVCACLFASPLAAMQTVIKTKSARSIPLPFTLACFLNCLLWSIVGVFELDDFNIYAPNLMGLASSLAQMALRGVYGDNKGILPH